MDNGTTGKFGVEIKLRSKLEKEISEQKVITESDERLNVPSVCVVVEGGPNTVATVHEAIKNGTPSLIIAGSGRAANILAYAFKKARCMIKKIRCKDKTIREEKHNVISEEVSVKVAEMLKSAFKEENPDLHLTRIKECVKFPHLINVYELDAKQGVGSGIDSAILHAILKANKGNVIDQLQLALVWNRVDVAKREIFTDDRDWKKGELHNPMRFAIENNLYDFVGLLIDHGVSMKEYLSEGELTILYNKIEKSSLIYDRLNLNKGKATLWNVGKVIKDLTMDKYTPLYRTDEKRFNATYQENVSSGSQNNQTDMRTFEQTDYTKAQYHPIRELFLYAILLNRKEMAYLLWKQIDEAIAAALTASLILKAMADKVHDIDQKENMRQHADRYEKLAIGVLNEGYVHDDRDLTMTMITRNLPNWGNTTCLAMAVQAEDRKFIAQSPVQDLLTQIWMGKISDKNNYWKLWLCMFCPPAVNLTVSYRKDARLLELSNRADTSVKCTTEANKDSHQPQGEQHGNGQRKVHSDKGAPAPGNHDQRDSDCDHSATTDVDNKYKKRIEWCHFYNAPVIKFRFNVLSYVAFLFLFSYIILTDFNLSVSWRECILIAWVVTLYIEEFRQIVHGESKSRKRKIYHWISDFWNMMDVVSLFMFGIGLGLRFNSLTFGAARIILSLDLMIFYMRLLQSFSVSKNLGPKLIMIARMMVDLLFFICILAVFMIGYGIASCAIMFPNESDPKTLFTGIFYHAYFQMYGQLFLENIEGEGCSDNITLIEMGLAERCPEYSWMGTLLLCGYMMLSNVLLLSLLIAMFSYTFSNVQDNTDKLWKFQRYGIIKEFLHCPPIPPPFIIIADIYFFIAKKRCTSSQTFLSQEDVGKCVLLERIKLDNFITREKPHKNLNGSVQTVYKMDTPLTDDRLMRMEDQLDRANKAIDWIITAMSENKLSLKDDPPKLKQITPREDIEEIISEETHKDEYSVHVKSRTSPYPGTAIRRFHVPDIKVSWKETFPQYKPVNYTHSFVLNAHDWADKDIMVLSKDERRVLLFNQADTDDYNRQSYTGLYEVQDGLPLNPKGRTGVIGRGMFCRFGPNHTTDPIVTRWKRQESGEVMKDGDKQVLEFIAINIEIYNQQYDIPWGIIAPGHQDQMTLLNKFIEEALDELYKTDAERNALNQKVEQLLKVGEEVYKGYVDDPRNTDNAWMETVAMNFHDGDGSVFAELEKLLQAGDDAQGVRWQRVSSKIPLFASHTAMLAKVAEIHNATF